jgi:hypothetical protein
LPAVNPNPFVGGPTGAPAMEEIMRLAAETNTDRPRTNLERQSG